MSVTKIWCQDALNKDYKVCYEIDKGYERWVHGKLVNYNGGNIVLHDDKDNWLYHISFSAIKWLLPKNK